MKIINGTYKKFINDKGQLHREDGPAYIEYNGYEMWCINGLCHREGGPAIVYSDGSKEWWLNGKMHRKDGPAIIKYNGNEEWWLNGIEVDEETYKKIENSSKEELLMYMVLSDYKDYLSLIEYRLNIV